MNKSEVLVIQGKAGAIRLLYSHDNGFTRHCVDFHANGDYVCRINEVRCFTRGTHEKMALLHGYNLKERTPYYDWNWITA